jgi:uncharacterized protein (DUF488 family)
MSLMTVGYEGLDSQQFFAILGAHQVETLVDVRELPISRKAGFSKNALSQAAASHHIRYVHMLALGCPKDIRHDYRADGDWRRYTGRFNHYLDGQQAAIAELLKLVGQERCCLMCFEADPNFCHRSFVAARVVAARPNLTVAHLNAPTEEATAPRRLAVV